MDIFFFKMGPKHTTERIYVRFFFYINRGCRQGDRIFPYIFKLCAEVLGKIIRKNKTIKGITIKEKEYKISQYTDDTQRLLDGSENTLNETLNVLNRFCQISGLKINVEKTRAIWIGAKLFSNDRLCHHYKLDLGQGPFKMLGVSFSSNVNEISKINTPDIMNKITHILNHWPRRKFTIIGIITIVKSLVLSKFVHFFI